MKPFLSVSIIVLVTLSACRTISATPALVSPQVQSPPGASETQPPPSSTPTLAIPSPTPTATALPADFGGDNFSRFVQVRSFVTPIEMALGMDILDLRRT
ncbi:MAG: hypothetical protein ABIJ39_12380 [Chloroflexota bacterium]